MLKHVQEVDVAIVGAGPAGLAAAAHLANSGVRFTVFDQGHSILARSRLRSLDLAYGEGGAGLFSDGKFSYHPSASQLWKLDSRTLRTSYQWFTSVLASVGLTPPPFPEEENAVNTGHKEYRSDYTTLEQRIELISNLSKIIGKALHTSVSVASIQRTRDGYRLNIQQGTSRQTITSKAIILATGRFGPLSLPSLYPDLPYAFKRIEIGVRIEQPSAEFSLNEYRNTDIKLISADATSGGEWRTFCTCRDGEVVYSEGIHAAASGRADVLPTGLTNIGLNLRIGSGSVGSPIYHEMNTVLSGLQTPRTLSLREYFASTQEILGPTLDEMFKRKLAEIFPGAGDATVYSPCIEGVGDYPELNANLQSPSGPFWVCGDATGIFRGITAAMVSGYFVAIRAVEHLSSRDALPVFIKQSKVDSMPTAFTAQSKAFFYCRDAVCEYTFLKGYLPLNPFRVFDYFLSDRVDRDAIRNGNNQLISLSDELWVFGPISDGVLFEIVRARNLNIPVRFFTIGTRSSEIEPLDESSLTFEPEIHSRQITREQLLSIVNGQLSGREQPRQEAFGF